MPPILPIARALWIAFGTGLIGLSGGNVWAQNSSSSTAATSSETDGRPSPDNASLKDPANRQEELEPRPGIPRLPVRQKTPDLPLRTGPPSSRHPSTNGIKPPPGVDKLKPRSPIGPQVGILLGEERRIVVGLRDTWRSLSAKTRLDRWELRRLNPGLRKLKLGQVLYIERRRIVPQWDETGIVVSIPDLTLFRWQQGQLVGTHRVAAGKRRGWRTPLGRFAIVTRERNPTWDVPVSIQEEMRLEGKPVIEKVLPGPGNPLGRYWLGLSAGAIGIHGTTSPWSIGSYATHGCIRLASRDAKEVFNWAKPGFRVAIVNWPVLVAIEGSQVYLQVKRSAYGQGGTSEAIAQDLLRQYNLDLQVDPVVVKVASRAATGYPVRIDWDFVASDEPHLQDNVSRMAP